MEKFSHYLFESRIDFLKTQFQARKINTSHDEDAKHTTNNKIIDHLATFDPSHGNKYTAWIVNRYHEGQFRQEDRDRVRGALTNFDKYKAKLNEKDINRYKKLDDLEVAVQPHLGTATSKAESERMAVRNGIKKLEQGDQHDLYEIESKEASQAIYGGGSRTGMQYGTNWCTASRGTNNMYDRYKSNGGRLLTIHIKDDEDSPYQLHLPSFELRNRHDATAQPRVMAQKAPSLGDSMLTAQHPGFDVHGKYKDDYISRIRHGYIRAGDKHFDQAVDAYNHLLTPGERSLLISRLAVNVSDSGSRNAIDSFKKLIHSGTDEHRRTAVTGGFGPYGTYVGLMDPRTHIPSVEDINNKAFHDKNIGKIVVSHPSSSDENIANGLRSIDNHAAKGFHGTVGYGYSGMHEEAAKHPNAGPKTAQVLIKSSHTPQNVVGHLMKRFSDSPDIVQAGLESENVQTQLHTIAGGSKHISVQHLINHALKSYNEGTSSPIIRAVIEHPHTSTDRGLANMFINHPSPDVRGFAYARNPNLPMDAQRITDEIATNNQEIMNHLAVRSDLTKDHVKTLWNNGSPGVLHSLLSNHAAIGHLSDATLNKKHKSAHKAVIAAHPKTPQTLLHALAHDPDLGVVEAVASNPASNRQTLAKVKQHPNKEFKQHIADTIKARTS